MVDYALRIIEFIETKRKVKFVGRCDSACTLFLGLPKSQMCIREGAYFRFHAPRGPTELAVQAVEAYMMRKYPKWVRSWINSQGGLSDQLITMNFDYASRFMQSCA